MRSGVSLCFPCEIYAPVTSVAGRKISDRLLEYRTGMLMLSERSKASCALDIDIGTVKPCSPSRLLGVLEFVHQSAGFIKSAQTGPFAVAERMTVCFVGPGRRLKSTARHRHSNCGLSEVNSAHRVVHVACELALASHDVDRHLLI